MEKTFNQKEKLQISKVLKEIGIKDKLPSILTLKDTILKVNTITKEYTLNSKNYINLRFNICEGGIVYF